MFEILVILFMLGLVGMVLSAVGKFCRWLTFGKFIGYGSIVLILVILVKI